MEQERKLAHIEKIEWIRPIEGADKIEVCGIIGWECVIDKKDNFKVGDKVTFTNDAGVVFPGHKVIGFSNPNELHGRHIHIDTDSHWFPHHDHELTKE